MVERANEQMFEIYSTTRQSLAIWETMDSTLMLESEGNSPSPRNGSVSIEQMNRQFTTHGMNRHTDRTRTHDWIKSKSPGTVPP